MTRNKTINNVGLIEELDEAINELVSCYCIFDSEKEESAKEKLRSIVKKHSKIIEEIEITKCQVCPECLWNYGSDTPFKCENSDCKNYDGLCIEGLVVVRENIGKLKTLTKGGRPATGLPKRSDK